MQDLQPSGDRIAEPDGAHQRVIVARLADFCRFSGAVSSYETDPWLYMRDKLLEIQPALRAFKAERLAAARRDLEGLLAGGKIAEEGLVELRETLNRYLSPGDFADAAIHLTPADLAVPERREAALEVLRRARPLSLFDEEAVPEGSRAKSGQRLVAELAERVGIDALAAILVRKPLTRRRKAMALRRLRRNVAEYCSVLHLPASPEDVFSPFMAQRVEALAIACLRLLNRFR